MTKHTQTQLRLKLVPEILAEDGASTNEGDGNRTQTSDHKRAVQAAVVGAGEAGGSHADRDWLKREAKFFCIDAAARRDDRLTLFAVNVLRMIVDGETH
jgi:hypothetical protein